MPLFDKILIANRGEIACRVMRTCKRLGIATVAVHSEADAETPHVAMADEKIAIGPPPAAQSYLVIERILDAIRATGAQAVHPGYGFLSENAAFAEALAAEGITFIGPPVDAIRVMGDKIESKRIAEEAGVHTVPGHPEAIADPEAARAVAREIGYPVMVKAAAGGGGKGMRTAFDEGELIEGLQRARSEARSSFGDDRVLIERFIAEPRHIEIQVLADTHGNVVHLFERECSIQRRHQKVIEEAPSPFLDEETRAAMGAEAVSLARAVGYTSAGTVEFIVDPERRFYFLEMNTRLQVEHPVTELITGLDLVEQMIRVAAGEPLSFGQDDLAIDGWAVEARIYAEEPGRGFLPSTGRIRSCILPEGDGIRVDAGVAEGGEVSMFYDPMIAKLCAHGHHRRTAIRRLRNALDGFLIRGVGHNVAFLGHVLSHPRFLEGRLSTGFIAEEYGDRFAPEGTDPVIAQRMAAIAVAMRWIEAARAAGVSGQIPGWALEPVREWMVRIGNEEHPVEIDETGERAFSVRIDDRRVMLLLDWSPGRPLVHARVDDDTMIAQVDPRPEGWRFLHHGADIDVHVRTHRAAQYAARMPVKAPPDLSGVVMSPMPGLIVSIAVEQGQTVKAGDEIAVLEAMKMENVLRAERDGTIAEILVTPGETVAADTVLVRLGDAAAA